MVLTIILSVLALLATFYQAYLQRVHNRKSLKPLIQIDVKDHDRLIYVRVQNNGLGPLIIEKLSFIKDGKLHNSIRDCMSLDPKSYHNVSVTSTVKKVILPNGFLDVFSIRFKEQDGEEYAASIRQELAALKLKVEGLDIYDNKISAERDLEWFLNYQSV